MCIRDSPSPAGASQAAAGSHEIDRFGHVHVRSAVRAASGRICRCGACCARFLADRCRDFRSRTENRYPRPGACCSRAGWECGSRRHRRGSFTGPTGCFARGRSGSRSCCDRDGCSCGPEACGTGRCCSGQARGSGRSAGAQAPGWCRADSPVLRQYRPALLGRHRGAGA